MSVADRVRRKLETLRELLDRTDLSPGVKAAFVVDSALTSGKLAPHFSVQTHRVFETTTAPTVMRGLRDLVIRRGTLADLAGVCAVDGTDEALVRARLGRGDALFLGILEHEVLAHTWFHRGTPFDEDIPTLARWTLAPGSIWSYAAAAAPLARQSGVFIKMFQVALRDMLSTPGAVRVQCVVRATNAPSVAMHERLGFREIAQLLTIATPIARDALDRRPHALARRAARAPLGDRAAVMIPFHFGADRSTFGWYHAPAASRHPGGLGVVLCSSHGDEYMCAFRTMRELAIRIAAAGFPVIRFDYHGTGDSVGSDRDPGRVAAWRASVAAAIDEVRARGGVDRAIVVGLSLGALFATLAAAERDDIVGLVLWSPVARGKAFTRAQKAFNAMSAGTDWQVKDVPGVLGPGDEEAGGFSRQGHARRSRQARRRSRRRGRARAEVLAIGRDATPPDAKLSRASRRARRARRDLRRPAASRGMMTARHNSKLPIPVLDAVTTWLVAHAAALAGVPAASTVPTPAAAHATSSSIATATYVETAVTFGDRGRVFGVVTAPPAARTDRPALLLVTIGANHHIGCAGMYKQFARDWAPLGFTTLRFDLGGIGDSSPATPADDNKPYPHAAMDDMRAAVDVLRARGFTRFVMIGLCSGGYHGFKAAIDDPSIVGLIVINSQTFAYQDGDPLDVTKKRLGIRARKVAEVGQSMRKLDKWMKVLRGEVDVVSRARLMLGRALEVGERRVRDALKLRGRDGAFGAEICASSSHAARIC